MARQPAASAPMQADMEECSLSTAMNSVSTLPSATYWAKYWGISVEGVMGKCAQHVRVDLAHGGRRRPHCRTVFLEYSWSFSYLLDHSRWLRRGRPSSRCRSPCSGRSQNRSACPPVTGMEESGTEGGAQQALLALVRSPRPGSLVRHSPVPRCAGRCRPHRSRSPGSSPARVTFVDVRCFARCLMLRLHLLHGICFSALHVALA